MLAGCAAAAGSVLLFVVLFVLRESWPALVRIPAGRFVTDPGWQPTEGAYNLLPMAAGTLLTASGALAVAGPFGIAAAIFRRFYAPPLVARGFGHLVALLAGIPSVVFGLWGLTVMAPLVARLGGSGQSVATAVIVLGLMILPTVTFTADAAIAAVPASLLHGGAALGLGRFAVIRTVALPAARSGIVAGLVLATGRALGETMAVLMVAGNVVAIPRGPFDPVRTLTANIALEMGYATASHRAVLFASGLALMLIVALLTGVAALFGRRHA